jgi:putative hydrolase of the HAD superfamily
VKIFFDVDGVIIDGWHFNPARRRPWDTELKQDLGVERDAFQKAFFFPPAHGGDSLMEKCLKGDRDLKEVLADLLPTLGCHGTADDFIDYWFTRNAHLNEDVVAIIKQLRQRQEIELYLATAQEPHRANTYATNSGLKSYSGKYISALSLVSRRTPFPFFQKLIQHLI